MSLCGNFVKLRVLSFNKRDDLHRSSRVVVVVQVLKNPNTYKLEIRVSHMKIHTYEIQLQSSAREGGKN